MAESNELCLKSAKSAFLELISRVDPAVSMDFVEWVSEHCGSALTEATAMSSDGEEDDDIMERITEDLRERVPFSGVLSSEKLIFPETEQSHLKSSTTINLDAFLYNDEEIEKLCETGKLSRYYCASCGSQNVKPYDFISHSMSQDQLHYIFKDVLPSLLNDVQDKYLVDVGSRLGAVLYGAALYSSLENICGIEMNKEFCQLQHEILQKYKLDKRVKIKCSNVCQEGLILRNADIVVLNNVFEFFQPRDEQARIWHYLRSTISKKGCFIVSVPSLEEATRLGSPKNKPVVDLENWVEPLHLDSLSAKPSSSSPHDEMETKEIYFYRVK